MSDATRPRRLSARMLVIQPLQQLKPFVVPLLGIAVLDSFSLTTALSAAAAVVLSLVLGIVQWMRFRYWVANGRLQISRGLLARNTRSIPLDRIRGVDIQVPPLHRLLGLAQVRIDAAAGGAGADEGRIDGVTGAEAGWLRAELLRRRAEAQASQQQAVEVREPEGAGQVPPVEEAGTGSGTGVQQPPAAAGGAAEPEVPAGGRREQQDEQAGEVLLRAPRRWARYAPLVLTYLLAPLAVLGGLAGAFGDVAGELAVYVVNEIRGLRTVPDQLIWILVLAAVVLVVAIPLLSIVGFAVINWDFTIRERDGSLVCERGLFTRRSVSLERRRIHGWELIDSPQERLGRAARLRAVVTGIGDVSTRAMLLPLAPRPEAVTAAARLVAPFEAPLRRHPPAARTRRLLRAVVPWLALAAFAEAAAWWWSVTALGWLAAALLALAALGVPLGLDRYHSLGHAVDGEYIAVRSGSLRRRQAVVDRQAIVGWTVKQTWFQRRLGLVTLVVGVGAGSGGYEAIDAGADQAVRFMREVTPAWIAR